MFKLIAGAWRYRFVSQNFVVTTLGNKYKRSFLGYLWSVLLPMARFMILATIFAFVFKRTDAEFYRMRFAGMLVFGMITTVANGAGKAFVGSNSNYIKRIYVPKLVFVVNVVLMELVNTLLVLVGVVILGLISGYWFPTWEALMIVPGFLINLVFLLGFTSFVAVTMVWFNDIQYFVELLMQTLYFLTPIIFPEESLPPIILKYNPFFYLVEVIRYPLAKGVIPGWEMYAVAVGTALAMFVLGLGLLNLKQDDIIYKI